MVGYLSSQNGLEAVDYTPWQAAPPIHFIQWQIRGLVCWVAMVRILWLQIQYQEFARSALVNQTTSWTGYSSIRPILRYADAIDRWDRCCTRCPLASLCHIG